MLAGTGSGSNASRPDQKKREQAPTHRSLLAKFATPLFQRGREKLLLLRRPFGATMRRIALTNAFVDLPTFFDIQVLAI